jgi:sulfite exporter TauE/SafE
VNQAFLVAASLTLAASVHCVGMCGGFVLAVSGPSLGARLPRLSSALLLQLGKATTYAFLGALAGALGARFAHAASLSWGPRLLALLAGLGLALAGLTLLGLRARSGVGRWSAAVAAVWQRSLAPLLAARPKGSSLVVGLAMGFLPCPLVYAGLAAAAATGAAAPGALTMAGVALGTVPALTLVALFGSALKVAARRHLAWAAGALLLVVGVVTAARGLGVHQHASPIPAGAPSAVTAPGSGHAGHPGH